MIKIDAFREKRRRLKSGVTQKRRKLRVITGVEAHRLAQSIVDDEEQIAVLTFMMEDQREMVRALYESECYGGPQ